MARIENQKNLYDLYTHFISEFLINKNSILDETKNIFTSNNINKCIDLYVTNPNESDDNFNEKIQGQFDSASDQVKLVFTHAIWLYGFSVNGSQSSKNKSTKIIFKSLFDKVRYKDKEIELFPQNGFGSVGSYHKQNKYWEINSLIRIFKIIQDENLNNVEQIRDRIEDICLYAKYKKEENTSVVWQKSLNEIKKECAMYNILLYLTYPEKYERIASNNHKRKILNTFGTLLESQNDDKNIDEKILEIRNFLSNNDINKKQEFDFYQDDVEYIWNSKLSEKDFDESHGLSFKKNIILYGPPGTGKTYNAKQIAKSFILSKYFKQSKENIKKYFEKKFDIESRIHHLQLHSNYHYEDFIVGIKLEGQSTKVNEGLFLNLCNNILKENSSIDNNGLLPHILILDEINRVDLSRLFGEAFSAIEYRNNEITLPNNLKLRVPENLYIIGTMNEIDFSLETLDFALRRRFIWYFYGYDENSLESILTKELNLEEHKELKKKIQPEHLEEYIERSSKLNDKISKNNLLGKEFQIGHSFFGDLIKISNLFLGREGYKSKVDILKQDGPIYILWENSIRPILEAFLGNQEKEEKENLLQGFKDVFFNVEKQKSNKR